MHIAFPDDKPFSSVKVYKQESEKDDKVEVLDPYLHLVDGTILKWKIRDGKKGERCYVKWTW